ncbi:MAG: class I SAM-dependent DNA methyltransferase [Acidimicrobiales bacterium]
MTISSASAYKREFWSHENLKYLRPHYRMRKVARVVNRLADGKACRLLDVGCGPAALRQLLDPNIAYHGIDIAIQQPSPELVERDLLREPIGSDHAPFDLIVAQGFFEYMADAQSRKFAEIADLLGPEGRFVVTYVNFDHRRPYYYAPYSNIQPSAAFRRSLAEHFVVERQVPTAHNWNHSEPGRWLVRAPNMYINVNVPRLTSWLAAEYIYVCRPRPDPA